MADTIMYSGQGYIYRCPECQKVDRGSPIPTVCRLCGEKIKLNEVHSMNEELYCVIREINALETGSIFGASPSMLEEDHLVRAAKEVGIDILAPYRGKIN